MVHFILADPRELATAKDSTVYAEGESLLRIEEMKPVT
jgi:hypothetical protein